MLNTIDEIEIRIKQLSIEITMGNYYDGWTLNGMKKEIKILMGRLNRLKNN